MKIFERVWLRSVFYGMALVSFSCGQSMSGTTSLSEDDEYGLIEPDMKHIAPESSLLSVDDEESQEGEPMDYWSPEEEQEQEGTEDETDGEEKNYDDGQMFVRTSRSYHQLLRNLRNNGAIKAQSSTLEYPVYREDDRDEPSCEELRAIWRLTKRAARQSLLTNEIPKHPSSFYGYVAYNGGGGLGGGGVGDVALPEGQAFGRIVTEPHNKLSPHPKPYRTPHFGSYDRVEEQLRQGMFAEKPYKQLGMGKFRTKTGVGKGSSFIYSAPYYVRPQHLTPLTTISSGSSNSHPIKSSRGSSGVIQVAHNKHGGGASSPSSSLKPKPYYNDGKYGARRSPSSSSPSPPMSVVYGVYSNQGGVTTDEKLTSSSSSSSSVPPSPPPPLPSNIKSRIHIKEPTRKIPNRDMLMSADQGYVGRGNNGYQPKLRMVDTHHSDDTQDIPRRFHGGGGANGGHIDGFSTDNRGCETIQSKKCQRNEDCSCFGFYGCVYGKCKTYTSNTKQFLNGKESKSSQGWWHDGSLSKEALGKQSPQPPSKYSLLLKSQQQQQLNSSPPQSHYNIPMNDQRKQQWQQGGGGGGPFLHRQNP